MYTYKKTVRIFASPNRDKRSGIERRRFSYDAHIPERRSGQDRRAGMRQEFLAERHDQIASACC
jgi:hypothetical protein